MSLIEGVRERRDNEDLARIQRSFEHSQARAKLGSWEYDLVTSEGWWSKQMYLLFGFVPGLEPTPLNQFLDLIHPDDRHLIAGNQERLTAPGQSRTIHYRSHPEQPPIRRFVEIVECVLRDAKPILAGTTQDITLHQMAA